MTVHNPGMDQLFTTTVNVNINDAHVNSRIGMNEQFHYENLAWLRSIDFFRQENSYLKNRLAEVVDSSSDMNFLAQAEHFQNQFIIKDEFLDELRHDVHQQERSLAEGSRKMNGVMDENTCLRQRNLRDQMDYLERDFSELRNKFNQYLALNL